MKLQQVIHPQFISAFRKLQDEVPMSAKGALEIIRARRVLETVAKDFEEARMKAAEKHGERTEDGFRIAPEKLEEFGREMQELLDVDVELDVQPVRLPDDKPIFTVAEIEALGDLIEG